MDEPSDDLGERVAALEQGQKDSTRRIDSLETDIKTGIASLSAKFDIVSEKYGKVAGNIETNRIVMPVLTAIVGAETTAIIALLMR